MADTIHNVTNIFTGKAITEKSSFYTFWKGGKGEFAQLKEGVGGACSRWGIMIIRGRGLVRVAEKRNGRPTSIVYN